MRLFTPLTQKIKAGTNEKSASFQKYTCRVDLIVEISKKKKDHHSASKGVSTGWVESIKANSHRENREPEFTPGFSGFVLLDF